MDMTYEEVDKYWDSTIARLKAEFPSEWSITGYKGHGTHDGVAWVAKLRLNGKVVAYLEDSGRGGGTDIGFWKKVGTTVTQDRESLALWDAAIKAALPDEKLEPWEMVIEALLQRAGK